MGYVEMCNGVKCISGCYFDTVRLVSKNVQFIACTFNNCDLREVKNGDFRDCRFTKCLQPASTLPESVK